MADIPVSPGTLDPDNLPWAGAPCREDLGIEPVYLTPMQKRIVFRALNVTALLVEMGADWIDIQDADAVRELARVVLPEGIGVE